MRSVSTTSRGLFYRQTLVNMLHSVPIFLVSFITSARISAGDITIVIPPTPASTEIGFFGKIEGKITVDEANAFGLRPESTCIKSIASNFSEGQEPKYCYLGEPTPWKLYPSYGWAEVTSIYKVRSVTLVNKTEDWVTLRKIKHNFKYVGTLTAARLRVSDELPQVYNSISHKIEGEPMLEGTVTVMYNGEESYVHRWGYKEEKVYLKKPVIDYNMEVPLVPLANFSFTLNEKKRTAEYEITYENVLSGEVAADFNPVYGSHHFYAIDVGRLVRETSRVYTEKLTVETRFIDFLLKNDAWASWS